MSKKTMYTPHLKTFYCKKCSPTSEPSASCNLFAIVTSKITGHITNIIIMKKFGLLRELPKVTQRHEVSKCCWKNGTNSLARCRTATNLQFVKNAVSVKHNKKPSAIK